MKKTILFINILLLFVIINLFNNKYIKVKAYNNIIDSNENIYSDLIKEKKIDINEFLYLKNEFELRYDKIFDNGVFRYRISDNSLTIIYSNIQNLYISYNNYIYYGNNNDNVEFCRLKLDTRELVCNLTNSLFSSLDTLNVNEFFMMYKKQNLKNDSNDFFYYKGVQYTKNSIIEIQENNILYDLYLNQPDERDMIQPILELTTNKINLYKNSELPNFIDYIKTVSDDKDNLTVNDVIIDSTNLDINRNGEYYIFYKLKDLSNNETNKVLTINVFEDLKPVLELKTNEITIKLNEKINFKNQIKTVSDDKDILSLNDVLIDLTNYNSASTGSYEIIYKIIDSFNNETVKVLKVNVIENTVKPINLNFINNILSIFIIFFVYKFIFPIFKKLIPKFKKRGF